MEKYYYSPERINCKQNKNHNYTECPEPETCPYAYCENCDIDYLSLDEIGLEVTTIIIKKNDDNR